MRVYNKELKLEKIICNQCGKETLTEGGLLKADYVSIDKKWGYFSNKDEQVHSLDLCEECYDAFCKSLKIKPSVKDNHEILD